MSLRALLCLPAFFLGLSPAFAATEIRCAQAGQEIRIAVDVLKSNPPQSSYVVFQDGVEVGSGAVEKLGEGRDEFLKSWVWGFRSVDAVIGVVLIGAERPQPGKFAGKAELFVKYNFGAFDSSSADCEITIQ